MIKKIIGLALIAFMLSFVQAQALDSYCIDSSHLFVDESYWHDGEYYQMNYTDICHYGCSVNKCIERGETMVFDMVIATLFVSAIGFACLFLAFKRESSIMWPVISTVIFFVLAVSSLTLGLGSGLNYIMSGIFLLFMFISLVKSMQTAFDAFKGKATV